MTDSWFQDLRFGLRQLARSPGFTLTAVLALGLGIGANSALFSVVDAVLLRPLPFPQADRLVMVWEDASHFGFPRNTPAPANWVDWKKENKVFTDIAAVRGRSYNLTSDGSTPEQAIGATVTASFWQVLDVKPVAGRVFDEKEELRNEKVAVISYGIWQRRFGGQQSAIGGPIVLNDETYTLLGVMPRSFVTPARREVEIWTPAAFTPQDLARRGSHFLTCVARLRPGVTVDQAQAEMAGIAKRLEQQYPNTNRQVGAVVIPVRDEIVGDTRLSLLALLGATACVLLIACANLANLLLARLQARERELALRAALGAGRGRLVQQMLLESLLLAFGGAAAGLLLAFWSLTALRAFVPPDLRTTELHLDWRVTLFTIGMAVVSALLFGLAPAFLVGRRAHYDALKEGGRSHVAGRHRLSRILVAAEVALALVLTTGAGLLIQTVRRLQQVDTGFQSQGLLTMTVLPRANQHLQREQFVRAVMEKVEALPGVESASFTSNLPLITMGNTSSYRVEGQDSDASRHQDALIRTVSENYLQTIGAQMREGRFFGSQDRADGLPVVIINETLAKLHFGEGRVEGKRLQTSALDYQGDHWLTVIGVVKEIRERGLKIETKPALYIPLAQSEKCWNTPRVLMTRAAIDPASLTGAIQKAIWSVDPKQAIRQPRTMDDIAQEATGEQRRRMGLLTLFAGLAIGLAALGLYGLLSYLVGQRQREIGVRLALGATPGEILGLVVRGGMTLTLAGVFLGIVGSLLVSRMIVTLLFGVRPWEPNILFTSAAVLVGVAIVGCYFPARRASRVDPMEALRIE